MKLLSPALWLQQAKADEAASRAKSALAARAGCTASLAQRLPARRQLVARRATSLAGMPSLPTRPPSVARAIHRMIGSGEMACPAKTSRA